MKSARLLIALSAKEHKKLKALSKKLDVSMSALVRRAIASLV